MDGVFFEIKTVFLSTPSARRAAHTPIHPFPAFGISIHALREEGDQDRCGHPDFGYISIHALREEGDSVLSTIPT